MVQFDDELQNFLDEIIFLDGVINVVHYND